METLQFHPDGLILASGTNKGVVEIWDLKSQTNVTNFSEHSGRVGSVAFSENGYIMASGAADGVKIWDLRNGACLKTLSVGSGVHCVGFDYSGVYLGVGADDVSVFSTKSWERVWNCAEDVNGYHSLLFGESARYLLTGCGNRSVVKFSNCLVC